MKTENIPGNKAMTTEEKLKRIINNYAEDEEACFEFPEIMAVMTAAYNMALDDCVNITEPLTMATSNHIDQHYTTNESILKLKL